MLIPIPRSADTWIVDHPVAVASATSAICFALGLIYSRTGRSTGLVAWFGGTQTLLLTAVFSCREMNCGVIPTILAVVLSLVLSGFLLVLIISIRPTPEHPHRGRTGLVSDTEAYGYIGGGIAFFLGLALFSIAIPSEHFIRNSLILAAGGVVVGAVFGHRKA